MSSDELNYRIFDPARHQLHSDSTVTVEQLQYFAQLYPHLHFSIRMQGDDGAFFPDGPRIGYYSDAEFITDREAAALSDMVPVDAMYLECLNYQDQTPVDDAVACDDIDEALRVVMDQCLIKTGDVAGTCFAGKSGAWFDADLSERRVMLLDWLAVESAHVCNARRKEYRRSDYQGDDQS